MGPPGRPGPKGDPGLPGLTGAKGKAGHGKFISTALLHTESNSNCFTSYKRKQSIEVLQTRQNGKDSEGIKAFNPHIFGPKMKDPVLFVLSFEDVLTHPLI